MSYIDKEKAIIAKLKSTDFEMFDGDAEDAYESIGTALDSFTNYANTVIHQQHMLPIYYARFEGQDLRDKIMSDDSRRKIAHDNAIAYVGFMNRLSDRLGLEPFADVDTNDRHEVARFIGDFVNETYNNGISGGFDAATYQRNTEYEKDHVKRLQDLDDRFGSIVEKSEEGLEY